MHTETAKGKRGYKMLKVRNQAYEIMENGKRLRLRKIWFYSIDFLATKKKRMTDDLENVMIKLLNTPGSH